MKKVIWGIFDDYIDASSAVQELQSSGFPASEIALLGNDFDDIRPIASHLVKTGPHRMIMLFSVTGAVAGFFVGLLSLVHTGYGGVAVAAPSIAAIAGATAGGALGSITGALVRFDTPEYEATIYQGQLTTGKVMLSLKTTTEADRYRVEEIMERCGAMEVDTKVA